MERNRAITSADNTLKNQMCSALFTAFLSTLYNDKYELFRFIFREYVKPSLQNIGHPTLMEKWKLNHGKSGYENNLDAGVEVLPTNKNRSTRYP